MQSVREEMTHEAEQAIFCLFKHPPKAKEQGRKRYLQVRRKGNFLPQ